MKEYEVDDPMELVGVALPDGEPDLFVHSIVQEYLMLGWSQRQIMLLFRKPVFAGTHRIYQQKGEAYVVELVERLCHEWAQGWERAKGGASYA